MNRHAVALAFGFALFAVAAVHAADTTTTDVSSLSASDRCRYGYGCGHADPQMVDFLGNEFEFFGKSGNFYNIYSDNAHQINMGLFDGSVNGHIGTYMNSYGFSCGESRVNVTLIGDKDLRVEMWQDNDKESSVLVSGQPMLATIGKDNSKLSIKMEAFETPGGHTVEIKSDIVTMSIRSAPAGAVDSVGVVQPAYLNFEMNLANGPVGGKSEGILGASVNKMLEITQLKAASQDDAKVTKKTKTDIKRPEDAFFQVTGMFGTDFTANLFTGAPVTTPVGTSRRSLMRYNAFAGVHFPLTAFAA